MVVKKIRSCFEICTFLGFGDRLTVAFGVLGAREAKTQKRAR